MAKSIGDVKIRVLIMGDRLTQEEVAAAFAEYGCDRNLFSGSGSGTAECDAIVVITPFSPDFFASVHFGEEVLPIRKSSLADLAAKVVNTLLDAVIQEKWREKIDLPLADGKG